jgi:hypothetical protein
MSEPITIKIIFILFLNSNMALTKPNARTELNRQIAGINRLLTGLNAQMGHINLGTPAFAEFLDKIDIALRMREQLVAQRAHLNM